ncbi:MAG: SPOR domain-containing protein [Ignavibacteriales bacterium]|nr:SPOR domain-containing protein [Ignavibacteriales bacterium]
MKIAQLQKKVADVLGVSASQKNLAFEIFIDKISEILLEDITIKVPRIGFFQLKTVSFKNVNRPLIFSPLSEDFLKDARQLYLTIDVKPKTKNTVEFDSDIFSIGVGKPLLPLSIDEQPDTETSYAMLKKSIEERVKELLTESDQIPNFNIWDDYYKAPSKYEDEIGEETKNQLSELTSDLKFKKEDVPDKSHENTLENYETLLPGIDKSEPPEEFNQFIVNNDSQDGTGDSKNKTDRKEDISESDSGKTGETITIGKEIRIEEEIISSDEDFSELEKMKYEDSHNQQITIAELMDGATSTMSETNISGGDEYVKDENIVPIKETIDRILADEKLKEDKNKIDNYDDELHEQNISAFEELHKIKDEVISSEEFNADLLEETGHEISNEKIESSLENAETPAGEIEEGKKSIFEELHQINDEVISSQETEENSGNENEHEIKSEVIETEKVNVEIPSDESDKQNSQLIEHVSKWNDGEETEEIDDETLSDNDNQKVEWNWGDELREEFGIPKVVGEELKYEMIDEIGETGGGLELTDDYLNDSETTKGLFDQLEKTLEREFNIDERPKNRFTNSDKKSTIDRNNLKKVVLEFSGPPAKYEFVEDRSSGKEKRMAITLIDENGENNYKTHPTSDNEPGEKYKDNYFRKMALIIFGSFIIVGSIVVFIILKGNSNKESQNKSNLTQQAKDNTAANDSAIIFTPEQIGQTNKDTSANPYEINDFPRTAFPPVPIKDATDKQILETIKNETAKLQSAQKAKVTPSEKQSAANVINKDRGKNVTSETRVSDRVYYDGKNYNLQISSWPNRARAEEELSRLRKLGANAIIVEANLPQKGGMWYRIRLGPYKTQKEAEEILKKNNF